ncbi:hypothetical protein M514_27543 [Trichuris suis]|uniref:Abnormal cell migration protein 18-like fibronectin type I domain-containing protein n=1 Tax=Trichuris suis TaxID=68888 RepID=A0A085MSS5_9BILA|nr:hypothetical protein M514_27543 [Trichuris suis]
MHPSVALLILFGCFQLSTVLSEKCLTKTSTSYYYEYSKIQVERVHWKYEQKERTVAIGCVLDSGENLSFGQIYRSTYFVLRCDKINDTAVVLTPLKCILNGKELEKGQQVQHRWFVYTCLEQRGRIGLEITGCVSDTGFIAKIGDTFSRKSFLFMCVGRGDQVIHKAVGCIINKQEVEIHKSVNIGKFWYRCSRYGNGGVQTEVMGCVDSVGRRIDAGARYHDLGFLFHCKEKEVGLTIVFAGCVAKEFGVTREFGFGESWYTKPVGSLSYRMVCQGNEKHVTVEVAECIANLDQGRKVLAVGQCDKYGDDRMFTCLKHESGAILARLTTIEQKVLDYKKFTTIDGQMCPMLEK